ncbi:conserved hypothetical protein; putative signal peptide [Bradyrhizobium sp. ORS 278]|uniref:hypothetical protein n=1 Tax=Bradyrhizobium sp. (strain ORS 278) TaxID=114615 RepID=UPI000150874F|nr:hypothetical protein [Bradyrhizobium sp. ORS 278]CAL76920.1 conserved hypothetical protein; putative signal peptide [Bradyrhizobium sp. ORS 278]
MIPLHGRIVCAGMLTGLVMTRAMTSVAAAERPCYETLGFPMSPHQLAALGPANAAQSLTCLPLLDTASPHQFAVLTPRRPSERDPAPVSTVGSVGMGLTVTRDD